jgi:type VI secretion system protein ImpH
MYLNNIFSDQSNGVETDFRAEVLAAEMIENNTAPDRVLIVPLGARNRPHRKDVESIVEEVLDYDNKEYVFIKTPREGLYDQLPEGLFHQHIGYVSNKSEQQVIEAIKRHHLEEKAARMFFLPFDVALNDVRVQITLYENQLDKKFHFNQLVNIFSSHWEIFQHLNVLQANIFLQFLPLIHRIRDDWNAIETLFELMFLVPANLQLRSQRKHPNSNDEDAAVLYSAIGRGVLGVDLTTGDPRDGGEFNEIVITFGPIAADKVNSFTGESKQEAVVQMLCDYLLPADLDIVIEYDFKQSDRSFRLSEPGTISDNCEMGVSTYL